MVLLAFIGLFRLSDIAMGVMANPFYIDMGFSLQQIANVTKIYGFVMSILGALLGGALVFRLGAARLLAPSVFLIAASNLTFSWLAIIGRPDPLVLATAISVDNLVSGMGGSVFIAFLSGLTNTAYTATQYALFTSIMTLPGKVIGGFSGVIVDWLQSLGARRAGACRAARCGGRRAQVRRLRDLLRLHRPARPARPGAGGDRAPALRKRNPSFREEGGAVRSATGCQTVPGNRPIPERGVGLPAWNRQAGCSGLRLQNRDWQCGKHQPGVASSA